MKKNLIAIAILGLIGAFAPCQLEAQSFGELLKKGKKVLETVAGNTNDDQTKSPVEGVNQAVSRTVENGIEITNSGAEYIDITPIGLYGVPTSENYGNVYIVLKVLMKEPSDRANFGGVGNDKMVAVDANGKVYQGASGSLQFDTPEGIPVQVVMDQPQLMFEGVKKTIDVMPVVKFGFFIDAKRNGRITLKNVPIIWNADSEEEN